jgi:hypothetical protein
MNEINGEVYGAVMQSLFECGEIQDGDILVLSRGDNDAKPVKILFKLPSRSGKVSLLKPPDATRVYVTVTQEGRNINAEITKKEWLE